MKTSDECMFDNLYEFVDIKYHDIISIIQNNRSRIIFINDINVNGAILFLPTKNSEAENGTHPYFSLEIIDEDKKQINESVSFEDVSLKVKKYLLDYNEKLFVYISFFNGETDQDKTFAAYEDMLFDSSKNPDEALNDQQYFPHWYEAIGRGSVKRIERFVNDIEKVQIDADKELMNQIDENIQTAIAKNDEVEFSRLSKTYAEIQDRLFYIKNLKGT